MFSKAIELDPRYAEAYAGLGVVEVAKVSYGWTEFTQKTLEKALASGRKALELDDGNASAHSMLADLYPAKERATAEQPDVFAWLCTQTGDGIF